MLRLSLYITPENKKPLWHDLDFDFPCTDFNTMEGELRFRLFKGLTNDYVIPCEKIRVKEISFNEKGEELKILPQDHDLLQQEFASVNQMKKYFAAHPLTDKDLVPETPNYEIVTKEIDGTETQVKTSATPT